MEKFSPQNNDTGKHEAFKSVDLDEIMKDVDDDFKSGKLTREQKEFVEPADISDPSLDRIDARSKGH
ncbi:MAG: hypothetical protein WAV98_01580 [Minisyncoccia bacterium]